MKRTLSLFLLPTAFAATANAAATGSPASWNIHPIVSIIILVVSIVLMLSTLAIVLQLYKFLKASKEETTAIPKKKKKSVMEFLLQLKPLENEKDLLTEHRYDGIEELDNPTPSWFMVLFYGTIIFAAVYLTYYHILDAPLMAKEYEMEMRVAREEKLARDAGSDQKFNEDDVVFQTDMEKIASGKQAFDQYCSACHGAKGEGKVGPNLTDAHWIHGGSAKDIFRTIRHGVPDKGMIAWEAQMKPDKIQTIVSYIHTLQGTNPPNAKEPQGELYVEEKIEITDSTLVEQK